MRTTLDIDDDLLQAAKDLARQEKTTAGRVVSNLLRQALTRVHPPGDSQPLNNGPCGFRPFSSPDAQVVNNDQVNQLRDQLGI